MSRSIRTFILSFLGVVLLSACGGHTPGKGKGEGDTLSLNHASRIKVVRFDGFTQVSLADPWNSGKTLHRYILVPVDKPLPGNLPEGTVVRTPLKKAVVSTSVHCGLIIDLGRGDAIAGICEPQYIHIPWVLERVKKGEIADCGSGLSPTVEKIIDLSPDAIFLSPFQNSGGYGQIEHLGIPIIETADYMETSALGRAEWMRYYGRLFDCGERADSLFHVVDSTYQSLKSYAARLPLGKSIITERMTGNVWYMPGGKSTIAALIRDAHARYAFADDQHSGSLPLSLEQVIAKAGQSDVWALKYNGPQPLTKRTLLQECRGYSVLKAMKTGQIYVCDCSVVPYFEEVSWRPDWQLREFIQLLHPQAKLDKLRYYRKENN